MNNGLTFRYTKATGEDTTGCLIDECDLINGYSDGHKRNKQRIIKISDFMDPNFDWKRKRFCIFAILFSEIKVPIARRPLGNEADRFKIGAYEKYPELIEMDHYLRKYEVKNMAINIRKRLETGNFDVKARINSWSFIRIFLLHWLKNWFNFFRINYWKMSLKENILTPITFNWNFVDKTYPNPIADAPEYQAIAPFPISARIKNLNKIRIDQILSSRLMISLFQFSYWVPISPDFIDWRIK
jgi:hypothetical protein